MDDFRLKDKSYNCYFELTFDLIGGKWKPVIIHHIGESDVLRYAEIKRKIPNITERMLTRQLRELEADGLVVRKVYPVIPPKVEYRLSDKGISIIPLLEKFKEFGKAYYHENDDKFKHKIMELDQD